MRSAAVPTTCLARSAIVVGRACVLAIDGTGSVGRTPMPSPSRPRQAIKAPALDARRLAQYTDAPLTRTVPLATPSGDLSFWPDVVALSACEVAGAFLGGVLVWVVYLPHFKTIPEPPSDDPRDDLLCTTGKLPEFPIP